jgi:hypothetical protein
LTVTDATKFEFFISSFIFSRRAARVANARENEGDAMRKRKRGREREREGERRDRRRDRYSPRRGKRSDTLINPASTPSRRMMLLFIITRHELRVQ